MDKDRIRDLYQQSRSFPLESKIASLVNDSTLSVGALQFLGTIVKAYKPNNVFEFGSGLSTMFFATILEDNPCAYIYSIDHSNQYLEKTRQNVGNKKNVTLYRMPIQLYQFRLKRFATYDDAYVRLIPRDLKFDMVLIDGPPGYRFGREAPLYQIAPFLKPTTLIILDDANREPEQEAISNWKRVWPGRIDVMNFPSLKKGLALIQIENPNKISCFPFTLRQIWQTWQQSRHTIRANRVSNNDED